MKILVSAAAAAVSVSLAAGVSFDDAEKFMSGWAGSSEDFDGTEVVRHQVVSNGNSAAYHMFLRRSGAATFIAADFRKYPVLAQSERVSDPDGNVTIPYDHPLWTLVLGSATSSTERAVLKSTVLGASGEEAFNRSRWSSFMSGKTRLSVTPVPQSSEFVLSGFESGGRFTHWNQYYPYTLSGTIKPVYNYYLLTSQLGGAGSAGLNLGVRELNCGCVATALSAAAQYHGCTGIRSDSRFTNDVIIVNADQTQTRVSRGLLAGQYDWSVLPSNFGGSAPAASSFSDLSDEARELLGRVAFNYGVAVEMNYNLATKAAGARYHLNPDEYTYDSYTSGFVDFVRSTLDSAHANRTGSVIPYGADAYGTSLAIGTAIRCGEPVMMSVSDGGSSGHCILAVGVRGTTVSDTYIRVFMGWSGTGDTWYYGGGSDINGTYKVIRQADVLGGAGNPTQFVNVKFGGCDIGNGTVADVTPVLSATTYSSVTGVVNSGILYIGLVSPDRTTSTGSYKLSGTVTIGASPFQYNGITIVPVASSMSLSRKYTVSKKVYGTIVDTGTTSDANATFKSADVTLNSTGSKANGFAHGTPEDFSSVMYLAFTSNVPLVIVSGTNNVNTPAVSVMKSNSFALLGNSVPYFVDVSDSRSWLKDWDCSYAVMDPFKGVSDRPWDDRNGGRLSYGTFDDPSEVRRVVEEGRAKYASLSVRRDNAYGIPWYAHPVVDTNPYYVPDGTTSLDMNSVRGQGYTSVHAKNLITITRSNVSYSDNTVRYVDFSECPATSVPSHMLRNFTALVTTDGLPASASVSSYCFSGCASLTSKDVGIAKGSVPDYAFSNCSGIADMSGVDPSVTSLGSGAFYGCTGLRSLNGLPSSVTKVGSYCFYNCVALDSTRGCGSVTNFGDYAFALSSSTSPTASDFTIEDWNAASIPSYAFNYRTNIKAVFLTNVVSVGRSAFSRCTYLASASFPSATSVQAYGLGWCYRLSQLSFGSGVPPLSIDSSALYHTPSSSYALQCIINMNASMATVSAMPGYPFTPYTGTGIVFHCLDGDLTPP